MHTVSQLSDYGLSDVDTCQDYLWFDTSANGCPQRICGDEIIQFHDELHTHSFIGILWTNGDNSQGRYEIWARCSRGQTNHTRIQDSSCDANKQLSTTRMRLSVRTPHVPKCKT